MKWLAHALVIAGVATLAIAADAPAPAATPAVASPKLTPVRPQPLISFGVPAFASSGKASNANDVRYYNDGKGPADQWNAETAPAWLVYDLSGVPAAKRSKILIVWYGGGAAYDYTIIKGWTYRMPGPYVFEGNAAAGGGKAPPDANWVTLFTGDSPQVYHSRQHVVDFTGYNWLRFRTLSGNPMNAVQNLGVTIKLDVYNAADGITDDWIVYGDSITAGNITTNCIGQLIHSRLPAYNPIWEGGGVGFMGAQSGATQLLPKWLPIFPGRYVCLAYGTNDANMGRAAGEADAARFYDNYESMVKQILAVKKIPVIGTVIWAKDDGFRVKNIQLFNAQLQQLKAKYPEILDGPDLYGTFANHPELFGDDLHPNEKGAGVWREAWATWAIKNVYRAPAQQ